jgi:hypothetical protein
MNNGFFGFSASAYGSSVISVTEFDSSATYQIPNGAKRLWIMLIGGGGGGGSGARQASGTNSYGGGGGAGGTQNTGYYFVNAIGSTAESNAAGNAGFTPGSWGRTLTIAIGAGGTGGASAGGGGGAGAVGGQGSPSFGGAGGAGGAGSDFAPLFGTAPQTFYPSVPAPRGPSSTFSGGGGAGSGGISDSGSIANPDNEMASTNAETSDGSQPLPNIPIVIGVAVVGYFILSKNK